MQITGFTENTSVRFRAGLKIQHALFKYRVRGRGIQANEDGEAIAAS